MEVVGAIFAGGYGKRLYPYTMEIPKPLLEIKPGYTILDKQLHELSIAGIRDVYLLVGYLHEKIEERFGDRYMGMNIHYLVEDKPMGTFWAFRNAMSHINGDVVLSNGDVICDISIKRLIEEGKKSDNLITVTVTKMQSPYGIVVFSGRKVDAFLEKPVLDHFINAGIYYIKSGIRGYLDRSYVHKDIEKTVFPEVVRDRKMGIYYEEDVYWRSIDSIKDLEAVRKYYSSRVDTEWGYERILTSKKHFDVRELYIRKGEKIGPYKGFSETIHVLRGEGILAIDGKRKLLISDVTIEVDSNSERTIEATKNLLLQLYREK